MTLRNGGMRSSSSADRVTSTTQCAPKRAVAVTKPRKRRRQYTRQCDEGAGAAQQQKMQRMQPFRNRRQRLQARRHRRLYHCRVLTRVQACVSISRVLWPALALRVQRLGAGCACPAIKNIAIVVRPVVHCQRVPRTSARCLMRRHRAAHPAVTPGAV